MGEISINPTYNVHKKYRQMNLVNPYRFGNAFVSTWKTDNLSTGSSTSTQIKLPLVSTGSYNFTVDWGDGSLNTITTWNQIDTTHTYSAVGTYTITIKGVCVGWQFNGTGDRLKILSIASWGKSKLFNSATGHFKGCANLNLSNVSDVPDLSTATVLTSSFENCTALTIIKDLHLWNVVTIINMFGVFSNCPNFNTYIGNWNAILVTTFEGMFAFASSFNNGYPSGVSGVMTFSIKTVGAVNCLNMFRSALAFNQDISATNTVAVSNMSGMFNSATSFNQNIGTLNISNVANFTNFMIGKTPATFSSANLDAIYNGWSALVGGVKPGITITFGSAKYTSASSAGRAILTGAPNNWVVTDGGI